ncbi:NAD-dependent epimerase [Longimycelium tulufanense]|uniref:NAD-dependent epimerase n=1 Tax=Longimycelium tulufanense TaxID=907463 RepID=A0A8J3CIN8_9PSEU|nr:NAD(P)-dependent oxidoreductase [Longimycelium tulufanense]GGM74511.1 NAD-dependent epimerase [Longimycelium tulufanense]
MRIVLFGATGRIGSRVLAEAVRRGHEVTAVARDTGGLVERAGVTVRGGSVYDKDFVAEVVSGADLVIGAISTRRSPEGTLVDAVRLLLDVTRTAGVRVLFVGGAGSLEVAAGRQLVDAPDFPGAYKPEALAHRDALEVLRGEGGEVDWSYLSPAAEIAPGARTGKFHLGGDELLVDDKGESRISMEDYAVALLDEAERPAHTRQRFTVAY